MAKPAGTLGPTPNPPKPVKPAGPLGPTPKVPLPKPAKGGSGGGSKGSTGGTGGGGGKGGKPVQHDLNWYAAQQVHLSEQPILQQIAAERAANLARAQAQMGFAKAAAAIMQQAAPGVQAGYANAANSDAGYAKGLGNLTQGALDSNAQAHNTFLANMGTPETALGGAAPVGTLSYGSQGYIPATSLQREGAAWGAAAQLAPGHQLAQGALDAGASLRDN